MPVLLTTADEAEQWLTAPVDEALQLQRPLSGNRMTIVATGERKDEAA
jgi:putative SOS response-associated peptidase YedK